MYPSQGCPNSIIKVVIVNDNVKWVCNVITLATEVDSHGIRRRECIAEHGMKMKRAAYATAPLDRHSYKNSNSNQCCKTSTHGQIHTIISLFNMHKIFIFLI